MPKLLNILINPHPVLRKKSVIFDLKKIKEPNFENFLLDLEKTMTEKDGAGLAAPQVGQNIRVIVINHENNNIFMINPEITKKSWAKETQDEGCLSVLNEKKEIIYAPVERHKRINCLYFDKRGAKRKIIADNMLARVIQHEVDHLDGILFLDRLKNPNEQPKTT